MSQDSKNIRTGFVVIMLLTGMLALLIAPLASSAKDKDGVRQTQQALHDKGYDPGPIDGVMGTQTRDAIGKYQESQGLPATRHVDEKTAGQLGVEQESSGGEFKTAGHNFGKGGKQFGHEVKEGNPGEAGKDLGKGIGRGGKDVGEGVKKAVTP